MLGPNEDVVKIFIMDRDRGSDIPPEVAQYLKFSLTELSMFIEAFYDEEEREVARIQTKYRNEKFLIQRRMMQEKQKMRERAVANGTVSPSVKL
jgi:Ras association domain-containing protein 2/4